MSAINPNPRTLEEYREATRNMIDCLNLDDVRVLHRFAQIGYERTEGERAIAELAALKAAGAKVAKPRKVKIGGNVVALRQKT